MEGSAVPLLEDSEADAGATASPSSTTAGGPSVAIETPESTITIDTQTLQFYLLAVQTTLLVYVTYKEVSR